MTDTEVSAALYGQGLMEVNTTPRTQAPAANSQVLGINIPALPLTPFVGLRPFNSNESLLFFGRSEQTVELLQQLHRTRFLAVVGSSGCGKSSLIYAGLLPKLKAGFLVQDRDQWLIATMKPGDRPLRNLAAALLAVVAAAPNPKAVEAFADEMRMGRTQAVIKRLTPTLAASDANLLVLVDQFEESFRFVLASGNPAQREDAADFVSILLALIQQYALPIYVVMTMRSDFLGECDNFYGLPEAMNHSQYLVPRLTRQQRQQAIEGPIRLFGQEITARLLDRVLNDIGEQADQLPVMQYALMRTWERWTHSPDPALDMPHYEAIGTIKDAFSLDANRALAEMSAEARKLTKRMFQALTDTDTRNRRVRRPLHLSGLQAITGASREQSMEIVEHFRSSGRAFLTVTADPDPLIDISHESLIWQWRTLKTWVAAEAESARQYQRLEDAAKRHQRRGAELWRGVDLEHARVWKEQEKPTAAWAARYGDAYQLAMDFLQASEAAEDKQRREQEQARQRELEQARELADVQTRAASRLKVIAGVIGVLLLITISLTIYAFDAKNKAKQQARIATSHQLVAHARSTSMRLDLALLSSLAASHIIDTVATRGSILDGLLRSPRLLTFLTGHTNTIASVTFSPDGKTLASGSWDNTIRLWDVSFGSWKDRACHIANHNLTPEEWKQYIGDIEPYRAMCPGLPIAMEAVSKSKANVQP
jgi:energy-coupling factor transporter ATP-binding protein EcfA2